MLCILVNRCQRVGVTRIEAIHSSETLVSNLGRHMTSYTIWNMSSHYYYKYLMVYYWCFIQYINHCYSCKLLYYLPLYWMAFLLYILEVLNFIPNSKFSYLDSFFFASCSASDRFWNRILKIKLYHTSQIIMLSLKMPWSVQLITHPSGNQGKSLGLLLMFLK